MLDISRGHPMLNIGIQRSMMTRIARQFFLSEDLTDIITVSARASVPLSMRNTGNILELPWISQWEREARFVVCNNDCCDCCGRHLNRITRSQRAPCLCESCNNELERDYEYKKNLTNLPLAVSPEIHNLIPSPDMSSLVFSVNWREQRARRAQLVETKNVTIRLLKRKLINYLAKLEGMVDGWILQYKYRA